jgi:hypothetical protein
VSIYDLRRAARTDRIMVERADILDVLAELDRRGETIERLNARWTRSVAARKRRKKKVVS